MSISKIVSYLKINKKAVVSILMVVMLFCVSAESAFAEGEWLTKEQSDKAVKILNAAITLVSAVLWIITSLIGILLYPGWVNGTLFGLQDYLKEIWILVSNIVYFIFAFIIIVIAFMNIVGKWEGNWELKQAMPKFIIGILIVPFSWFFVQFVLAISAILTVWVLTLPYDSFKDQPLLSTALEDSKIAGQKVCRDVIISLKWDITDPNAVSLVDWDAWDSLPENIKCRDEEGKVSIADILSWESWEEGINNSMFGIINVYTYGILRIQELDTLKRIDLTSITAIADLVLKIVFDLLFVVVYFLLMVALFLALFARWVRLWIYAMLSPAFWLLYFFWKSADGVGSDKNKFSIKEFIALALVPVYVAAALSFGLVFILVATQWLKENQTSDTLDTIEAWGFKLEIIGAHSDGSVEKSVIAKLIVEIFWVVILWIAVMAALKTSTTTWSIIEPIEAFWKSVWELAAKAPTYAPIIPTGGWPWSAMSVASLPSLWSALEAAPRQEAQKRWASFADGVMGPPGDIQKVQRSLDNLNQTEVDNWDWLKKSLEAMGTWLFKQSTQRDEQIKSINSRLWLEIDLKKSNDPKEISRQINDAIRDKWYNATFDGEKTVWNYINRLYGWNTTETPPVWETPAALTNLNLNINASNQITDNAWVKNLNDAGISSAVTSAKALSGNVEEDELNDKLDELIEALWVTDVRTTRNAIIDKLVKEEWFTFKDTV